MTQKKRALVLFTVLVLFLVAVSVTLVFFSPSELVDRVGVRNGYLLAVLISFFGGFSSGGSISFITVLATLAAGGLNPIVLGLLSGVSLAIGDFILFTAGKQGRALVSKKWDKRIDRLEKAIQKRTWLRRLVPFLSYLYIGFAPLPNDLLLLFLAAIEYPPRRTAILIVLGDITFPTVLTFSAHTIIS